MVIKREDIHPLPVYSYLKATSKDKWRENKMSKQNKKGSKLGLVSKEKTGKPSKDKVNRKK